MKKVFVTLIILTIVTGGIFSWFASTHPDGLEWSMFKTAGLEELESPGNRIYAWLGDFQKKTAFLPDYNFKVSEGAQKAEAEPAWPSVDAGTSVSGIAGGMLTLAFVFLIGFILKRRKIAVTGDYYFKD